jgi:hypothetical protein
MYMITISKGQTIPIYITAKENLTNSANFVGLFFTNRITQEVVSFMFNNISTTDRYMKMSLVVNTYFANAETGFWTYKAYQTPTNNINTIDTDSVPVETGLMYLSPVSEFEPTKYSGQNNTFVTYG